MQIFTLNEKDIPVENGHRFLALFGGFTTHGKGCPDWGSNRTADTNFVGDKIGDVVIRTVNGNYAIPLVFGYTLWFPAYLWADMEPLTDSSVYGMLDGAMYLEGALERRNCCVLNIRLPEERIVRIEIAADAGKVSKPVFLGGSYHDGKGKPALFSHADIDDMTFSPENEFFLSHTVEEFGKVPDEVLRRLSAFERLLCTFEEDIPSAYTAKSEGTVRFYGTPLAEIATDVLNANKAQLCEKTDADGFLHTSGKNTYWYYYHGFGPRVHRDVYYNEIWSRDSGRAVMTLLLAGRTDKAAAAIDNLNGYGQRSPVAVPVILCLFSPYHQNFSPSNRMLPPCACIGSAFVSYQNFPGRND